MARIANRVFAVASLVLSAGPAMAQTIPAGTNPTLEFLGVAPASDDPACSVGHLWRAHGKTSQGKPHCVVSINQCASIHGTIGQNAWGNWACKGVEE